MKTLTKQNMKGEVKENKTNRLKSAVFTVDSRMRDH